MCTLSPAFWSRPQAPITNGSLTDMQYTASTPFAFSLSKLARYDGTCFAEHVGVNAPGNPKITTFLPLVRSSTLNWFGPTLQPLPSTSTNSDSVPSGRRSPTLIVMAVLLAQKNGGQK